MNLKSLERCLTYVEQKIVSISILSILEDLKKSSFLDDFLLLKSEFDISSILHQAESSYSPLRVSSLLCLEIASSRDPISNEIYYLRLVESLLEATLYYSVLEIVDHLKIINFRFLRSAIFACFKTNKWQNLLRYSNNVPENQLTIDIQLIITRALLEVNKPYKAYQYLQEIRECPLEFLNQYMILTLLTKQKLGQFTLEDINSFFVLISSASPSETAALANIWPTIETFISKDEMFSDSLAIIINHFWSSLSANTLLVDGFSPLPSLTSKKKIRKIVFVTNNINSLTILQNIASNMESILRESFCIDIAVVGDISTFSEIPVDVINLTQKSVTATVRSLRDLQIDILIDTIGSSNNRWLEILAQKVSTYQIAWFPTDLASFSAKFYNYIIADRWTKPRVLNRFSVKIFEFTGITLLSNLSFVDNHIIENNTIQPVDTFFILDKPEYFLPGSQYLIKSLVSRYPNVTFQFTDDTWQEPGLFDFWWSSVFTEELAPNQLQSINDINSHNIIERLHSSLIVSFSSSSPTNHLTYLLSKGIPIACLSASTFQGRSMIALLESLGLGSFVADDLGTFNEIIDIIVSDFNLRMELTSKLPLQFKSSLTVDYQLFAADLCQSVSLLSE